MRAMRYELRVRLQVVALDKREGDLRFIPIKLSETFALYRLSTNLLCEIHL
jgi:hypothetical protein